MKFISFDLIFITSSQINEIIFVNFVLDFNDIVTQRSGSIGRSIIFPVLRNYICKIKDNSESEIEIIFGAIVMPK
jgi:hypothetical protein